MKLDLVQYSPVWEDKQKNMEKISTLLKHNSEEIDVLIFPEMTLTGFTMNASKFAETLTGESFNFFSDLARNSTTNIIAGIIEHKDSKYYNSLIHLSPEGKLVSVYRKIHPFSFSSENKFYEKGTETVITSINNWKIGLSICYDLRFPELYRQYAKQKTELIINIANWPDTRIEHWRVLLRARAIENQCYAAGVNRIGKDPKLNYIGYSAVYNPMGDEVISSVNKEEILSAEIFLEVVEEVRSTLPFLDDICLI
jgi:predicted amidohydrolase